MTQIHGIEPEKTRVNNNLSVVLLFQRASNLQHILKVIFEAARGLTGEIDQEPQVEAETQPEKHPLSGWSK